MCILTSFADLVYATSYYCADRRGVTVPHLMLKNKHQNKPKVDLYLVESILAICCVACSVFSPAFFFFFFKFSSGVERCSTLNTSLNVTNDILYVKCCFFPPLKEKAHTEAFKNLTRQLFISISFSDIW